MEVIFRFLGCAIFIVALISCGGGSGGGTSGESNSVPTTPQPVVDPVLNISPGGFWVTQNLFGDPSSKIYISETGKFMLDQANIVFDAGLVAGDGSFIRQGIGQISFADSNEIRGRYQRSHIALGEPIFTPNIATCELTGNLVERVSLNVSLSCTDTSNGTEVEMLNLATLADCSATPFIACVTSETYDLPSSLDLIAGDYSQVILGTPSEISISALGQVSGGFDNGIECDITGTISVINENFNLYDAELTLSDCLPNIGGQSGRRFEGFFFVRGNGNSIPQQLGFIVSALDELVPPSISGTYSEIL